MKARHVSPDDTPLARDAVIEAYKAGIDRTLIVENLRRTPEQRLDNLASLQRFVVRFRGSAWDSRRSPG